MKVIPAVDIQDGRCVRLLQGDFDEETVFADDPVEVARRWQRLGADLVHVVDLDGARTGVGRNTQIIGRMLQEGLSLQVGGGIRGRETAGMLLDAGVGRIVMGTAAVTNPGLLEEMVDEFADRLVVGVDCRGGKVAVRGWTSETCRRAREFCCHLAGLGVQRVLVTDIDRDGMLTGPNLQLLDEVLDTGLQVIASGGVGSEEHLQMLTELSRDNPRLEGVIVGRALYDGTLCPESLFQK